MHNVALEWMFGYDDTDREKWIRFYLAPTRRNATEEHDMPILNTPATREQLWEKLKEIYLEHLTSGTALIDLQREQGLTKARIDWAIRQINLILDVLADTDCNENARELYQALTEIRDILQGEVK